MRHGSLILEELKSSFVNKHNCNHFILVLFPVNYWVMIFLF